MTLVCDTSGLLAAMNVKEPHHQGCAATVARHSNVVVSPLVLAELDYLAAKRVGRHALRPFYEDLADGVYQVGQVDNATIADARALDDRYDELGLGLTDAVNVVLAHDYHTADLLTLDAHYRAVKPLSRHGEFRLLPTDFSSPV